MAMLQRPNPFPSGQIIGYPGKGFVHIASPSARYPVPSFFISRKPKEYIRVTTVAEASKLWPSRR